MAATLVNIHQYGIIEKENVESLPLIGIILDGKCFRLDVSLKYHAIKRLSTFNPTEVATLISNCLQPKLCYTILIRITQDHSSIDVNPVELNYEILSVSIIHHVFFHMNVI